MAVARDAGADSTLGVGAQLKGAGRGLDYNIAANHFRTDGWRDHSRARRESLTARIGGDLGGGRLELLLNALDAPDAQDPLGLSRARWRPIRARPPPWRTSTAPVNRCASQQTGLRWTR
ncbi:hypothetical protein ACE0DR_28990 [Azotobacter sp. CWF10]